MNDATQLTYVCRSNDELLIILARLARVTTREYPIVLYQMRRETFLAMLDTPLEARLAAIDAALGSEYDLETVNNLLEEKAEILVELEKG
jgi:hypothetical protein